MDLTRINIATRSDNHPPMKKMTDLEIGKKYDIVGLKSVKTKYGMSSVATIDGFAIFLPTRIGKFLHENPDQLEQMIEAARQRRLQLHYHGGRFNKCEFFSEKSTEVDFTRINHTACLRDFLPTKKLSELKVGERYEVTDLKAVKTKYGSSILVTIDWKFTIFLPSRIVKVLEEDADQLAHLKDEISAKHIQLHYLGGEFNRSEFCNKMQKIDEKN